MNQFEVRCLPGVLASLICFSAVAMGGDTVRVEQVLIRLIEEADVPARDAGAIETILVHEGDAVKAGTPLARLDTELQELDRSRAQVELKISRFEAKNQLPVDLANKSLEIQRQSALEQDMKRKVAYQRADDKVKIQSSRRKADVAKKDLDRAIHARKEFAESISDSELDTRQLNADQAEFEFEQATLDHKIAGMLAQAEDLAQASQQLTSERALLEVQNAKAANEIAKLEVGVKENQLETASANLARRSINSPIDGIIVELHRNVGEWVRPGDSVARVIRLDRLRAEGFVTAAQARWIRRGAKASIQVTELTAEPLTREGMITFISPEIDPVNNEVRVWAEFDNPQLTLSPGMHCALEIQISASEPD